MCDDFGAEIEQIASLDIEELLVSLKDSQLEKNDKPKEITQEKIIENKPKERTVQKPIDNKPNVVKGSKKVTKTIGKLICEKCGTLFKRQKYFNAHNCTKPKKAPKPKAPGVNVHVKKEVCVNKAKRYAYYYKCDKCSFLTLNTKTLEAHNNKVHLQVAPYTCDVCQRGFFKKSNMARHVATHFQKKDVSCDTCGHLFVNKTTLTLHKRLHAETRAYECTMCEMKFVTSSRRSAHIKRMHMEKTEFCVYCNMKFSTKPDLKSHLTRRHAKSKIPLKNKIVAEVLKCKLDDSVISK